MPSSRCVLLPYKMGSQSAKVLAAGLTHRLGLKLRRVRPNGKYRPKRRSLVVNYGSGARPMVWPQMGERWLNLPTASATAGNKLHAFEKFRETGLSIPDFTTDQSVARTWIDGGSMVVARTILNG